MNGMTLPHAQQTTFNATCNTVSHINEQPPLQSLARAMTLILWFVLSFLHCWLTCHGWVTKLKPHTLHFRTCMKSLTIFVCCLFCCMCVEFMFLLEWSARQLTSGLWWFKEAWKNSRSGWPDCQEGWVKPRRPDCMNRKYVRTSKTKCWVKKNF